MIVSASTSMWQRPAGSRWLALLWLALLWLTLSGTVAAGERLEAPLPPGWHTELELTRLSPLAAKDEFAARVLLPTVADRLQRFEQATGVPAKEHSIDLAGERFDLFVPKTKPRGGYGLLVFVPPIPEFPPSADWKRVLNQRGYLLVMARDSGNTENALDRRIPLALHAWENVVAHYPVDPERTFISGFSGGARVAQRMAMAFPDIFAGVALFGSSDPLGEGSSVLGGSGAVPPLPALMQRFREHSRVVFTTGREDLPNRTRDARTRQSFTDYCIHQVSSFLVPRLGHWVPDRRYLDKTLDALEATPVPAPPEMQRCIERMQTGIDAELDAIEALLEGGDATAAGQRLGALEDRAGGLAAPRSVDLARRIVAALPSAD